MILTWVAAIALGAPPVPPPPQVQQTPAERRQAELQRTQELRKARKQNNPQKRMVLEAQKRQKAWMDSVDRIVEVPTASIGGTTSGRGMAGAVQAGVGGTQVRTWVYYKDGSVEGYDANGRVVTSSYTNK